MRTTMLAASVCWLVCGCAASGWDGEVQTWGTLRGVLREGDKSGKVDLEQVVSPHAVGLGALAGLEGEIAIFEGAVLTSRVDGAGALSSVRSADDRAALLAVAEVRAWRATRTDRDLALEDLDGYLEAQVGSDGRETFPFVLRGPVDDLATHVLAGRCPYAPDDEHGSEPVRSTFPRAEATLVGFHTRLPPGTLTHHGSRTHVHAIVLDGPDSHVGHVDEALIPRGTELLLPAGL